MVLLVKRAAREEEGSQWSIPGGTNMSGESIEETLLREIKEELGVNVVVHVLFKEYENSDSQRSIRSYYFVGDIEGSEIRLDTDELSDFKWFPFEDVPKDLAYGQNRVIADYISSAALIKKS